MQIEKDYTLPKYLALSALLHFGVLIVLTLIYTVLTSVRTPGSSGFVNINFNDLNQMTKEQSVTKEEEKEEEKERKGERVSEDKNSQKETPKMSGFAGDLNSADTVGLNQIYSENTLNVRVRFPAGWSFIDQNKNNKLDGVTFISTNPNSKAKPYVHIEVKDPYYFNANRFIHHEKVNGLNYYYNDEEELENQISFTVYIKTGGSEDYSLKLIINGREYFAEHKNIFMGMLKTFKFGTLF